MTHPKKVLETFKKVISQERREVHYTIIIFRKSFNKFSLKIRKNVISALQLNLIRLELSKFQSRQRRC